jgi:tetratricopeptide (TPR) repeat protein
MGGTPIEGAVVEGSMDEMAMDVMEGADNGERGRPELGQPPAPGGPGGEDGEKRRKAPWPSNRALTITIVLTTLVAAVSGFLLNRASASASNASDMAQQLSLRGSAVSTSAYQQAETDYAQYLNLQAEQAKAAEEMIEAGYDQPDAANWGRLYDASMAQARRTGRELPKDLRPDLVSGNPDPEFPYDFFDRRASDGTYLEAVSDAYNDVSGQWDKVVDSYTAILTMLAVALFLFGSAYVLYGRNRVLFSAIAAGLVVVGLAWGGSLVTVRVPDKVSLAAARDYAKGVVALAEASTPLQYMPALNDFTAAIKARPDYASAYAQRAQAEDGIGSQELGSGFVSNVAPHWARLAAKDDLEAYTLGDHGAQQVSNVGWDDYSLWLMDGSKGQPPAQSLEFNAKAVQLDPANPVNWMNLGVDQLADGDYGGAAKSYQAAATHILYTCRPAAQLGTCKKAQPSEAFGLQEQWLAGGMQDLEGLAASPAGQRSPALGSEVTKAKGILTGSVAMGKVVAGPRPLGFDKPLMSGFIDPNIIQLDVALPHGVTRKQLLKMPLTVIWYQRAKAGDNWNGIADTECWGTGGEDCVEWKKQGDGYFQFRTRFLEADSDCFTDVQYKAELYVRGSLVGSVTLTPSKDSDDDYISTNLSAATSPDMNFGVCVPSTWALQPLQTMDVDVSGSTQKISGALSGAETDYASPDKRSGVILVRFYTLHEDYTANKQLQQLVTDVAEYAVGLFKGNGLPSDISESGPYSSESLWGDELTDMMAKVYSNATDLVGVAGALVSSGSATDGMQYQDSTLAQNASLGGPDDAVVVALVYGPTNVLWSGQHALGLQILSSCSLLND